MIISGGGGALKILDKRTIADLSAAYVLCDYSNVLTGDFSKAILVGQCNGTINSARTLNARVAKDGVQVTGNSYYNWIPTTTAAPALTSSIDISDGGGATANTSKKFFIEWQNFNMDLYCTLRSGYDSFINASAPNVTNTRMAVKQYINGIAIASNAAALGANLELTLYGLLR